MIRSNLKTELPPSLHLRKAFYGGALMLFLIAAGVSLLASGCASYRAYPKRAASESQELTHLVHYFTDDVMAEHAASPDKSAYRTEVVMGRLRAIDLLFLQFEQAINKEKNGTQIATDWAVLGLSGAGATAGGVATKALLAAISGGLTGAKLSVNEALFYKQTMPVLLQAMQASRKAILVDIRKGLKSSLADYHVMQALNDVDRYYEAGTLPGAMISINSQTGEKNEKATQALARMIEINYSPTVASGTLRTFWRPNGSVSDENKAAILQAMREAGVPEDVEISQLLSDPLYANQRERVVDLLRQKNKIQ